MAAVIKQAVGVDSELIEGGRGEFTVWVGEEQVASKGPEGFPTEEAVLTAVQHALAR